MSQNFNATSIIVDDDSPEVSYSSQWFLDYPSSAEYNTTKHGASIAGLSATFTFNGISVAVYGSLGSIDVYGRPVSSYSINGTQMGVYQAPIVAPGGAFTNVLFFQSPTLPQGTHTLEILNTNGTAPSELWLDYIVYTPGEDPSVPPPSSSGGISSSSSVTQSPSTSLSTTSQGSGLPASVTGSQSTTGSASTNTALSADKSSSGSNSHTAAIVGGVIGGLVFIALVSAALWLYRRRKIHTRDQNGLYVPDEVRPFGSFQVDPNDPGMSTVQHSKQVVPPSLMYNKLSATAQSSTSTLTPLRPPASDIAVPSVSNQLSESGVEPIVNIHLDSGVRLPPVVDVPPVYSSA